jgi:hypothetical protein
MGKDTYNVVSNKRVIDMSKNIALLQPDAAPLTVLLKNIAKESCRKNNTILYEEKI